MRSRALAAVAAVSLGLLAPRAARAEAAPEALTLRRAIELAAQGNVDLKRQNVALRTAAGNLLAAEGQFDVVVGADGSFTRRVNPIPGGVFGGNTDTWLGDVYVSRALESGGKLTLQATEQYIMSNSLSQCGTGTGATQVGGTGAVTSCGLFGPGVQLVFTHPLLRGFGREITEANLRKQRINQDVALLNRQAHASVDVRDTVIAFWELAYQAQDLDIRRSAEALARAQLKTTEAQVNVGRMGALEAAAVNRAIAQAQVEVATSEQQLMARSLDLERLLGVPVPKGFAGLRTADAPTAAAHDVNVDAETERALASSPALKALRRGLALTAIDVAVAAASLRPQLDLAATVGRATRDVGFIPSLRELGNNDATAGSIGLTFSLPIQNRAARGNAEVARAAEEGSRLDAHDLELSIRDGVARFAAQIRSAGARIEYARSSVGFAQQNLEAEQARFEVGRSTNNDVLLRQQELKQAQISVARAVVDLLEADAALSALGGDILDVYGVILRQ